MRSEIPSRRDSAATPCADCGAVLDISDRAVRGKSFSEGRGWKARYATWGPPLRASPPPTAALPGVVSVRPLDVRIRQYVALSDPRLSVGIEKALREPTLFYIDQPGPAR